MKYTDVSDVRIEVENRWTGAPKMIIRYSAAADYRGVLERATSLSVSDAFTCCGMRTLSGMNVFMYCPVFQEKPFLEKLKEAYNQVFHGGNIAFVLSNNQKKQMKVMLQNMREMGGLRVMVLKNHMPHHSSMTLYVWTYKGAKRG